MAVVIAIVIVSGLFVSLALPAVATWLLSRRKDHE